MPTVSKSVIVARPAATMYALVDDCERYPQFLPWCSSAVVHERTPATTRATLVIEYRGLHASVSTLNRNEPPEFIHLELVDGPFDRFKGRWRFVPLGEGCRVEFSLDYALSSRAMESLLGPVFGHIAETLVDRFVARAEAVA